MGNERAGQEEAARTGRFGSTDPPAEAALQLGTAARREAKTRSGSSAYDSGAPAAWGGATDRPIHVGAHRTVYTSYVGPTSGLYYALFLPPPSGRRFLYLRVTTEREGMAIGRTSLKGPRRCGSQPLVRSG